MNSISYKKPTAVFEKRVVSVGDTHNLDLGIASFIAFFSFAYKLLELNNIARNKKTLNKILIIRRSHFKNRPQMHITKTKYK